MSYEEVKINSGGNSLVGGLCLVDQPKGGVLFISGGGTQPHRLFREWQERLAAAGYSSLAFDFPGVGDSPGELADSSLNSRLADSERALAYLAERAGLGERRVIVCGRSMGGPLALRLAAEYQLAKTILLFPAAYAAEAYGQRFGDGFTEILRRQNSWAGSPDFDLAEKLPGELLVVYGDADPIIPRPIQDRYLEIGQRKGRAAVIPGAGHTGSFWGDDPSATKLRDELYAIVDEFLGRVTEASDGR